MEDPRQLPAPSDREDRIRAFAKDLAYGAFHDDWGLTLYTHLGAGATKHRLYLGNAAGGHSSQDRFDAYLERKWGNDYPDISFLKAFGFLVETAHHQYSITLGAKSLLIPPVVKPLAFISYVQRLSSPLALLIEARLVAADVPVFIDKHLPLAAPIPEQIEHMIKSEVSVFIPVLAPGSLKEHWIIREFIWALEAGIAILPVHYPGFEISDLDSVPECPEAIIKAIKKHKGVPIHKDNADSYEMAMQQLVARLAPARSTV